MTPETLIRHELAGLAVSIEAAPNQDLVGLTGRVVDETMHTLQVSTDTGGKQIPKTETTFRFHLEDADVLVDGNRLVARPARRTEMKGGSVWQ